ncbi:LOW QUALITY PROTEIN: serine/arginine repetitive matrix protein 2-like, partial [Osmerus mordax]|uniref:LOW QUALITY PROTEIN: serine/arginine repetitive matrix protein 2-like n=1 Tax=Osmerus mordax TaxID=8014 RepID=UPI00350ED90E
MPQLWSHLGTRVGGVINQQNTALPISTSFALLLERSVPPPTPTLIGGLGSPLLLLAHIKAQLALTQLNAIAIGNAGPTLPPSPSAAALSLLNLLKTANAMSHPLYNPWGAPYSQPPRPGPAQYSGSATQAVMDPLGAARLGGSPGLQGPGGTSSQGGMLPPMAQQMGYGMGQRATALTPDMESSIDMHIRGAREEARLLSHMGQQAPGGRNPRLDQLPRNEGSSLGGGLSGYPPSSSSSMLQAPLGLSDRGSVDWPSYQTPSRHFTFSAGASLKPQSSPQMGSAYMYGGEGGSGGGAGSSASSTGVSRSAPMMLPSSSPSPSSSSRAAPRYTSENASSILATFGLSNEDLEMLSHYPDEQLTPENLPYILRDIRIRKAARTPTLDVDHRTPPGGGGGLERPGARTGVPSSAPPLEQQPGGPQSNVIDYRHASGGGGLTDSGGGRGLNAGDAVAKDNVASMYGRVSSIATVSGSGSYAAMPRPDLSQRAPSPISLPQKDKDDRLLDPKAPKPIPVREQGGIRPTAAPGRVAPRAPTHLRSGLVVLSGGSQAGGQEVEVPQQQQPPQQQQQQQQQQKPPLYPVMDPSSPSPMTMHMLMHGLPRVFPHTCSLCSIQCAELREWARHQDSAIHIEKCRLLRKQLKKPEKESSTESVVSPKFPAWVPERAPDRPPLPPDRPPLPPDGPPTPLSRNDIPSRELDVSSTRPRRQASKSHSPSPCRYHGNSPSARRPYQRSRSPRKRARGSRSRSPRRHARASPPSFRRSHSRSPRRLARASPPSFRRSRSPRRPARASPPSFRRFRSQSPRRPARASPSSRRSQSPRRPARASPPSSRRSQSPRRPARASPPSSRRRLARSRSPSRSWSPLPRRPRRGSSPCPRRDSRETSAERLARKLVLTAGPSITDRSSMAAMMQRLAPALLAELAKKKAAASSSSKASAAKRSSSPSSSKASAAKRSSSPSSSKASAAKRSSSPSSSKGLAKTSKTPRPAAVSPTPPGKDCLVRLLEIPTHSSYQEVEQAVQPFGKTSVIILLKAIQEASVLFEEEESARAIINCNNLTISGEPITVVMDKDVLEDDGKDQKVKNVAVIKPSTKSTPNKIPSSVPKPSSNTFKAATATSSKSSGSSKATKPLSSTTKTSLAVTKKSTSIKPQTKTVSKTNTKPTSSIPLSSTAKTNTTATTKSTLTKPQTKPASKTDTKPTSTSSTKKGATKEMVTKTTTTAPKPLTSTAKTSSTAITKSTSTKPLTKTASKTDTKETSTSASREGATKETVTKTSVVTKVPGPSAAEASGSNSGDSKRPLEKTRTSDAAAKPLPSSRPPGVSPEEPNTPGAGAGEGARQQSSTMAVEATPIKLEATPIKLEATPIKLEATPIKLEATPIKLEAMPTEPEATPTGPKASVTKPEATPTEPEATPTEPEATPTEPEATPTEPEATVTKLETKPTEAEATLTKPEATPMDSMATPTETKATVTKPEATPMEPEATVTIPEATPTKLDTTPTEAEATLAKPEATPMDSMATPTETKATVTKPEATPMDSMATPTETKATVTKPEATPMDSMATPTETKATVTKPDATSMEPEITPTEPEATVTQLKAIPTKLVAAPTEPEATPTEPEATPTEPEATPTESEAMPAEPETTVTEPEATPTQLEARPMDPMATPTEPKAMPMEQEATPTEPGATPTNPMATPTEPEATPTDPEPLETTTDPQAHVTMVTEPSQNTTDAQPMTSGQHRPEPTTPASMETDSKEESSKLQLVKVAGVPHKLLKSPRLIQLMNKTFNITIRDVYIFLDHGLVFVTLVCPDINEMSNPCLSLQGHRLHFKLLQNYNMLEENAYTTLLKLINHSHAVDPSLLADRLLLVLLPTLPEDTQLVLQHLAQHGTFRNHLVMVNKMFVEMDSVREVGAALCTPPSPLLVQKGMLMYSFSVPVGAPPPNTPVLVKVNGIVGKANCPLKLRELALPFGIQEVEENDDGNGTFFCFPNLQLAYIKMQYLSGVKMVRAYSLCPPKLFKSIPTVELVEGNYLLDKENMYITLLKLIPSKWFNSSSYVTSSSMTDMKAHLLVVHMKKGSSLQQVLQFISQHGVVRRKLVLRDKAYVEMMSARKADAVMSVLESQTIDPDVSANGKVGPDQGQTEVSQGSEVEGCGRGTATAVEPDRNRTSTPCRQDDQRTSLAAQPHPGTLSDAPGKPTVVPPAPAEAPAGDGDKPVLDFPPITTEILKALEAAVHQHRLIRQTQAQTQDKIQDQAHGSRTRPFPTQRPPQLGRKAPTPGQPPRAPQLTPSTPNQRKSQFLIKSHCRHQRRKARPIAGRPSPSRSSRARPGGPSPAGRQPQRGGPPPGTAGGAPASSEDEHPPTSRRGNSSGSSSGSRRSRRDLSPASRRGRREEGRSKSSSRSSRSSRSQTTAQTHTQKGVESSEVTSDSPQDESGALELSQFNLDGFVTVDEVGGEVDSAPNLPQHQSSSSSPAPHQSPA